MKKGFQSQHVSKLKSGFFGVSSVNARARRLQSTSTMGILTQAKQETPTQPLRSTALHPSVKKDFSTLVQSDFHFDEMLSASLASQASSRTAAYEMDLAEAAASRSNFDKILLLVNHGEAAVKKNDPFGHPLLTGRGVGQALTLSRQTARFCNADTGLSPELVVLAPLGCSVQTILHAFPYSGPDMVRGCSWVCRADLAAQEQPASVAALQQKFPGMEYSVCEEASKETGSKAFLKWLQGRQERVIIVSSTTEWFQTFYENALGYDPAGAATHKFQTGEMRAVGLNVGNGVV